MKNRLFYILLRLLVLLTRKKLAFLNDYMKKFAYLVNKEGYEKQGAKIGEKSILINCTLSSSSKGDRFYIGKNCTITGATLLAHDASPTLFLNELIVREHSYLPGSRLSYRNPIHIGDNVFIGWGCIVLPGVSIGDNVVVGAGSVVTKNIPSGVVVAGNPAKAIKPIDEYIDNYRETLTQHPECF